jgi:hypothetical protein
VRFLAIVIVFVGAPLLGCINTDAAVFVDPTLSAPAATVVIEPANQGTGIMNGAFHLDLHLGARASGPSTVKLGEFSILDAAQTGPIVSPLNVASSTAFPVTVQLDSDVNADFTFDTGVKLLPATDATPLCAAAGVVISGTIDDSLMGTSTVTTSPVFHLGGCP